MEGVSSLMAFFHHIFLFLTPELQRRPYLGGKKDHMSYYNDTPAERAFLEGGPFFHLCTKALESDVFFHGDSERTLAVNYLAIAIMESGCRLLAFSIMSNHFHFVLEATDEQVAAFWQLFKQLLGTYFARHGRPGLLEGVEATPYPISNLKQLRNTIAYVIRNGFAARQDVHVFADPWSSGFLYFNPMLRKEGVSASTLKGQNLRDFTRSRKIGGLDGRIFIHEGQAQFWSFVDYPRAEQFFDHCRQFVNTVLRNVEGMVEVSMSIGESPSLSDDELLPFTFKLCKERLGADYPSKLDTASRKQLALWLKQDYRAGNKQIARLTRLPLSDVDAMFPMAATARQ